MHLYYNIRHLLKSRKKKLEVRIVRKSKYYK